MKRIRVLQVVGSLNLGGAETWLVQLLRYIRAHRLAEDIEFDFLVHRDGTDYYTGDVLSLGSRILHCPGRLDYAPRLFKLLRREGPYHIVHSHLQYYSGLVLSVAACAGVPVRIAHSHSDTRVFSQRASLGRRAYEEVSRFFLRQMATHSFAVSTAAAVALFGASWRTNPSISLLHCGIDSKPFQEAPDRARVRAEFGFSEDALVLGHVGRFIEEKNHLFLLKLLSALLTKNPQTYAVLIGEGPLRHQVEQRIAELGVSAQTRLLGIRSDVPKLLTALFDVFVFPSVLEGFPLALVEAQAAGLPVVASDRIAGEAFFSPSARRLSLEAPIAQWVSAVLSAKSQRTPPLEAALFPFSIDRSAEALLTEYRRSVSTALPQPAQSFESHTPVR